MKQTEYDASPAWSMTAALADLVQDDLAPESESGYAAVVRLQETVSYLEAFKDATKAEMVEASALDDLARHATAVKNSVDLYNKNREENAENLVAAGEQTVNIIAVLKQAFPPLMGEPLAGAVKASATRYANSLSQHIDGLVEMIRDLNGRLAAEQAKRDDIEDRSYVRAGELEAKLTAADETIAELASRLESQITEQAAQFAQEASKRAASFKTAEAERDAAHEERVATADTLAEEQREAESKVALSVLGSLREYEQQAKALVDSTSRHAVSGNYADWADHQAKTAFWWTLLATAFGVGVVVGLIWAMHSAADDSAQFVAYKISVGLLAAAVGGYAAKQAAEHRVQERRFKRLALDVAALEPFLATLNDASDIRAEFAKRVFAPDGTTSDESAPAVGGSVQISNAQVVDLIKSALLKK